MEVPQSPPLCLVQSGQAAVGPGWAAGCPDAPMRPRIADRTLRPVRCWGHSGLCRWQASTRAGRTVPGEGHGKVGTGSPQTPAVLGESVGTGWGLGWPLSSGCPCTVRLSFCRGSSLRVARGRHHWSAEEGGAPGDALPLGGLQGPCQSTFLIRPAGNTAGRTCAPGCTCLCPRERWQGHHLACPHLLGRVLLMAAGVESFFPF